MKVEEIITKVKAIPCTHCIEIHLETISGEPHSKGGGVWTSVKEEDLRNVLEKINLGTMDKTKSGWEKHLNDWKDKGILTGEDLA